MLGLSFEEWYWLVSVALIMGTIHHLLATAQENKKAHIAKAHRHAEFERYRKVRHTAKVSQLTSEVPRTRLMLESWILRHPHASLRHPGAKIALWEHVVALRAIHETLGTPSYRYPEDTAGAWMIQFDDPYWRAIWHLYTSGGPFRKLPSIPEPYPVPRKLCKRPA